ncbi:MAG: hypothetical protein ACI9FZ_001026 [Bacteroidia bacterium]|jgi:hypothetical protein
MIKGYGNYRKRQPGDVVVDAGAFPDDYAPFLAPNHGFSSIFADSIDKNLYCSHVIGFPESLLGLNGHTLFFLVIELMYVKLSFRYFLYLMMRCALRKLNVRFS